MSKEINWESRLTSQHQNAQYNGALSKLCIFNWDLIEVKIQDFALLFSSVMNHITASVGFNEFGFNESSRFNELVFDLKYFLLHKKSGFSEFPGV